MKLNIGSNVTHIVYRNSTQFKFCRSKEEADKFVELFGKGSRVFICVDEFNLSEMFSLSEMFNKKVQEMKTQNKS